MCFPSLRTVGATAARSMQTLLFFTCTDWKTILVPVVRIYFDAISLLSDKTTSPYLHSSLLLFRP